MLACWPLVSSDATQWQDISRPLLSVQEGWFDTPVYHIPIILSQMKSMVLHLAVLTFLGIASVNALHWYVCYFLYTTVPLYQGPFSLKSPQQIRHGSPLRARYYGFLWVQCLLYIIQDRQWAIWRCNIHVFQWQVYLGRRATCLPNGQRRTGTNRFSCGANVHSNNDAET